MDDDVLIAHVQSMSRNHSIVRSFFIQFLTFDAVSVLGSFRIRASFNDMCFAHLVTTVVKIFELEGWFVLNSSSSPWSPQKSLNFAHQTAQCSTCPIPPNSLSVDIRCPVLFLSLQSPTLWFAPCGFARFVCNMLTWALVSQSYQDAGESSQVFDMPPSLLSCFCLSALTSLQSKPWPWVKVKWIQIIWERTCPGGFHAAEGKAYREAAKAHQRQGVPQLLRAMYAALFIYSNLHINGLNVPLSCEVALTFRNHQKDKPEAGHEPEVHSMERWKNQNHAVISFIDFVSISCSRRGRGISPARLRLRALGDKVNSKGHVRERARRKDTTTTQSIDVTWHQNAPRKSSLRTVLCSADWNESCHRFRLSNIDWNET